MTSSPHRIRRQRWLVSTATNEHAFTLRNQFRERWEDVLLPVFETAFDEFSNEDEFIHIPRLEIKLKLDPGSELWEDLPQALYEELATQLRSIAAKRAEQPEDADFRSKVQGSMHNFKVLIHYLTHGNLPWQASSLQTGESLKTLKETIDQNWSQLLDYIRESSFSETSYFRLLQLLSAGQSIELVNKICDNLSYYRKDDLKIILLELLNSGNIFLDLHSRISLSAWLLASGFTKEDQPLYTDMIADFSQILRREKKIEIQRFIDSNSILKSLFHSTFEHQLPGDRIIQVKETQSPGVIAVEGDDQQSSNRIFNEENEEKSPGVRMVEGKPEIPDEYSDFIELMERMNSVPSNNLQGKPRLKVQHAGLLLLHPFLTQFFEHTGILADQGKDISFFNLPRAAALLHFLATGNFEVYEFELGFIKLLLGMDPEQSLPVSEGLISQQDDVESEALLQSVINHWSVLKNTSIDGLRASFLQRSALLNETDEGWMVQMETAPFDMLINQLPWSFTIIKLPWMKKPIYTEWQTL